MFCVCDVCLLALLFSIVPFLCCIGRFSVIVVGVVLGSVLSFSWVLLCCYWCWFSVIVVAGSFTGLLSLVSFVTCLLRAACWSIGGHFSRWG